jgi:hypothetical protein
LTAKPMRWPYLRSLIEAWVRKAGAAPVEVFSADHDIADIFAREAGLATVLDRLRCAAASGETPPAILLVGLYAEDDLRERVILRASATNLFDWPGLSYLRFVFGEDDLKGAIAAMEGRYAPLPLPTHEELALRAANIRHWLNRVTKGLTSEAKVFADAVHGSIRLAPTMLKSRSALSPEHDDSLVVLAASLSLVPEIADGDMLSTSLTNDTAAVRRANARLEAIKSDGPGAAPEALAEAAAALSSAGQALDGRVQAIVARLTRSVQ